VQSKFLILLVSIALTIPTQECAAARNNGALTAEKRDAIKQLEIYNLVIQDEILPPTKLFNSNGIAMILGGVFTAIIAVGIDTSTNEGRSRSAINIIKPLWNTTVDFDFRKLTAKEFNRQLEGDFTLNNKKDAAEMAVINSRAIHHKINQLKDGGALLVLNTNYRLIKGSTILSIETKAALYDRSSGKVRKKQGGSGRKKSPKKIYETTIYYESGKVGTGDEDSIALWNENNAALYRKTLEESIKFTAENIRHGLQARPNEHTCKPKVKSRHSTALRSNTVIEGRLVDVQNGRIKIHGKSGHITSTTRKYTIYTSKHKNNDCK